MMDREEELLEPIFEHLNAIPNVRILAGEHKKRLGVISFIIDQCHYNLAVQLLNDRFGIQTRGGCSCAGTYGHHLLNVLEEESVGILQSVMGGNIMDRPGWIRMSIHPTFTDKESTTICNAIMAVAANWEEWGKDYTYDSKKNEFIHKTYKRNFTEAKDWIGL